MLYLKGRKKQEQFVYKMVEFCFQFGYLLFKLTAYLNNRKVAEAVNRFLSTP